MYTAKVDYIYLHSTFTTFSFSQLHIPCVPLTVLSRRRYPGEDEKHQEMNEVLVSSLVIILARPLCILPCCPLLNLDLAA